MKTLLMGLALGLGAAVPIGPVNIEIIKRNILFGINAGLAVGMGACLVDLIYFGLLLQGLLYFLTNQTVIFTIGLISCCVLAYFGYQALSLKASQLTSAGSRRQSIRQHCQDGFIMTATNPYTILFWASVSSQLTMISTVHNSDVLLMGLGIIIGIGLWLAFLNILLHYTRAKFSASVQHYLNLVGGWLLIALSCIGFYKVIMGMGPF